MKVKLGDIIEIPLSDGRKAYGQYVFWDRKIGPLLQIFDKISSDSVKLEELNTANCLFPPIITGLFAAVKEDMWKIVGNLPILGFVYPGFISTLYNEKTRKAGVWYLWNGQESIRLGEHLPESYKKLEYLVIWSPFDVVNRIETGEYPYPYADLILNNQFVQKNR